MTKGLWGGLAATAVAIIGAAVVWFSIGDAHKAALLGEYWSAVAATLAFGWLVAGYHLQGRELRSQGEQLAMQRQELVLQRAEMHRMAEQATLGQVATMLSDFNKGLPAYGVSRVSAVQDIPTRLVGMLGVARHVVTGNTPLDRFNAWNQWGAIEGLALQFVTTIASAARLYAGVAEGIGLRPDTSAARVIVSNIDVLREIPHVQTYMTTAEVVAQFLVNGEAYLSRVRLAGLTAVNEVVPGSIRREELERLRANVDKLRAEEGLDLPPITEAVEGS